MTLGHEELTVWPRAGLARVLAPRPSSIAKRLLWISPVIEKSRHAER
jgi:hypothetical protein